MMRRGVNTKFLMNFMTTIVSLLISETIGYLNIHNFIIKLKQNISNRLSTSGNLNYIYEMPVEVNG